MKSDFYKEGFELAFKNGEALHSIANISAIAENYGIACSLNILAAEEILKASFLLIQHHYPQGKINEFENIFHKHKVKHDQLRQYVEFQSEMQEKLKRYLEVQMPLFEILKKIYPELPKETQGKIGKISKYMDLFQKHSAMNLGLDGIFEWLKMANENKNKGFYVDKSKTEWLSPLSFTKQQFQKEVKFTEAIFQYVENLKELFQIQEEMKNFS